MNAIENLWRINYVLVSKLVVIIFFTGTLWVGILKKGYYWFRMILNLKFNCNIYIIQKKIGVLIIK